MTEKEDRSKRIEEAKSENSTLLQDLETLQGELDAGYKEIEIMRSQLREKRAVGYRQEIRKDMELIKHQEQEVGKSSEAELGNKRQFALSEEVQKDLRDLIQRVFDQFFEKIDERGAGGAHESITEVDVQFQGQVVPFIIDKTTTFGKLRTDASKYWYLREQDVFFTSEEGRTSAVHLLDSLVLEELYPWLTIREKTGNRKLYLVLGNFENVASKLDPFIRGAGNEMEEDDEGANDEANANMKQEELAATKLEIKSRMRKHLIMNLVQSFLYIALVVIWVLFLLLEKNVAQTSWMNFSIQKTLFFDTTLDSSTLYSVYPDTSDPVSMRLSMVRDPSDFWNYLEFLRDMLVIYPKQTLSESAVINMHIRLFHKAELRQIRKAEYNCTRYSETYNCVDSIPSLLGNTDPALFVSDSNGENVTFYDYYASREYTAFLDIGNVTDWDLMTNYMKLTNWFNLGTRAVILTFNAYSPDIAIVTVVRCIFEVNRSMKVLAP